MPRTRWLAVAIALLGATLTNSPVGACPVLNHTVPPDTIEALARGFNLDGWLNGKEWTPSSIALLRELRDAGITHVRLPISADRVMPRFASKADRAEELHQIDLAVNKLLTLGYSVSVDLHGGGQFDRLQQEEPEAALQELKAAWTDLAQMMQGHPRERVFAELLNEPGVDAGRWQIEAEELAVLVRRLLPRTTIIVGPVNWQRADSLPGLRPLDDLNVVYAIHMYDPMIFTHQGHWDPAQPLSNIRELPFPILADDRRVQELRHQLIEDHRTQALVFLDEVIALPPEQVNGIARSLEPAAAWQRRYGRPIIINEFGVLKFAAPRESRLRWLSEVVTYAEQHCWGWAHWELSNGFGAVDFKTGQLDAGLMQALLGRH